MNPFVMAGLVPAMHVFAGLALYSGSATSAMTGRWSE